MNYLNYFSPSEDYEIKLHKGTAELPHNKEVCLEEFSAIQENIKKIFLEQIDNYIDQYIEKVLK
jgi:hypothetical protein